jgi:uncharacterized membrane protein
MAANGNERARLLARRLVLTSLLLLVIASTAAALWSSHESPSFILAAMLLVPLLLPLVGIVRGNRRTHAWATLCVLPGFVYGTTEVVANPDVRPLAALVLGSGLVFFCALIAYLRVTRPGPPTQPVLTP